MDKMLEMLMGMVASKQINVTVNVYNGGTPIHGDLLSTLEPYDGDDLDDELDVCPGCSGLDDDEDGIDDCSDCDAANIAGDFALLWDSFKTIVITQMPDASPEKAKILRLMDNLETSILG